MAFLVKLRQSNKCGSVRNDEIINFSEEILTSFGDIPYISLAFLELILFNKSCTLSGVVSLRKKQYSLEGLKFRLAELNETVSNQAITIHQLDIQVEDLQKH